MSKSFTAARIAAWWIDSHPLGSAFVVTSAPTAPQVSAILWREIGRAHTRGDLIGRLNKTEWYLPIGDKEELVAFGRKPSDYEPTAFQGIHAKYVLYIFDEACGMPPALWEAADSLIANDFSKALAIGNPDDPNSEFAKLCRPGSGWNVVQLGAFDSPNFTGEAVPDLLKHLLIGRTYVEEKRKKWAPTWKWNATGTKVEPPSDGKLEDTHPFWQSKILGLFPEQSTAGTLIPLAWIRAAQERSLPAVGPNELGLDVGASEDGDPSCCGHRIGPVFRVLYEDRQPDTMKTTGKLLQTLADASIGATCAKVDYIGVGRGVVDRAREQKLPVFPISVGEASTVYSCRICRFEWDQALLPTKHLANVQTFCPKCGSDQVWTVFANMLSQLWWSVRGLFERGEIDIDPVDEQLAEELLMMKWAPNSKGQTKVEYIDGPSPNRADSVLMCFAPIPPDGRFRFEEAGMTSEATW